MIADLNAQFLHGGTHSELRRAGLLVHQLDAYDGVGDEDGDYAHIVGQPWMPSGPARFHDRFSCALISRKFPHVYSATTGGMILNPAVVEDAILCSYAHDGGTDHRTCSPPGRSATCLPGCGGYGTTNGRPNWCSPGDEYERDKWCPWPRDDLWRMLAQHERLWPHRTSYFGCHPHNERHVHTCLYNEVLVDAAMWVAGLPSTIDAFFVLAPQRGTRHERSVRAVRAAFLEAHHLPESASPLLSFDLTDAVEPLRLL